jgi:hypothetical protein
MTESVGNNEIWQICNLPSKVHFCNSINITGITKNVFNVVSSKKNPVRTKYETKNTSTFQLFHCQQTQSLLITLYFPFFLGNFVIKGYSFVCHYNQKETLTESIKKNIDYHLKNKSCPLLING